MGRRVLARLDAAPDQVSAAAVDALELTPGADGSLTGRLGAGADAWSTLRLTVTPDAGAARVRLEAVPALHVPYFTWAVRGLVWLGSRRALRHALAVLEAALTGAPAPPAPRRSVLVPPVPFTHEQAARLAAIAAVAAIANFGGGLLTQNGDAVTRAFDRSDEALTFALALARAGVLLSLLATIFADRYGRRRMILLCLGGVAVANAVTAVAPTFEVFTGAQIVARSLVNGALVLAGIAVVEEAPDGARAYAFSIFGLALGLGFGLAVTLLPLADLGDYGWRLAFAISALSVLTLPGIARNVRETRRFDRLAARLRPRWRGLEAFDRTYRRRFVLLAAVAFLNNVFSAPSSQLTNRYLTSDHDFSNTEVAAFRGATAGVPGFVGLVLAGRLAETRGRRGVAAVGLLVASGFQAVFFLGDGILLWVMPAIALVAAALAGLAIGTMDGELFPTEARGSSNGFLLVCAVAGSATGLLVAGQLEDSLGGLGPAIALCAAAPVVAAVLLVPRLPETRARTLDEISPSELEPDDRPREEQR